MFTRKRRFYVTGWISLTVWATVGSGLARGARLDYALELVAPDGVDCVASEPLQAAIEARAGYLMFLDDPEPDRRIRVSVSRAQASWHARLQLLDAAGALVGERTITSTDPSCSSLDEAMVIVLTTWVGVAEAAPPLPPPAAETQDPTPAPRTTRAPVDAPTRTAHSPAATTMTLPTSFVLHVGAAASVGALPGATWAGVLALGLELGTIRLQLGVELTPGSTIELGANAAARFTAALAEAGACQRAFAYARTSLGFCAGVQAGLVGVSTSGLERVTSRSDAVVLAKLGPELRIDWTPSFGVAFALRAVVPLLSAHYYFLEAGQRRYYHSIDWGLSGTIGAFVRFDS